jgi:4-hydroxy-tetrahydrodipicolinate synthase
MSTPKASSLSAMSTPKASSLSAMSTPKASSLSAVLSPVITPFNADGSPNTEKLLKQCKWLEANGVGHAVFGTNSEANSISTLQKLRALDELIRRGLNPANMMPGTGACSIDAVVQMTKAAVDAKCGGVLMVPPFY